MQTATIKTTIELDAHLVYLAKKKGLEENKSLKEIINESLAEKLEARPRNKARKLTRIGGYKLGGIKNNLSREEIYEDL